MSCSPPLVPAQRIFVLCPSMVVSGGPESLHLLTGTLRRAGLDARIVYVPRTREPVQPAYRHHGIAVAAAVEDLPDNLVIVPEIWSHHLDRVQQAKKAIWWLSVDNYLAAATRAPFDFAGSAHRGVHHLVGSAYARHFLGDRGVTESIYLSSYVDRGFADEAQVGAREPRVLYNPKKGMAVLEQLQAEAPHLAWTPIRDLDRRGVARLLGRSRVYVDFGHHPGKERLPREAAMAGCCVVTGMKGSAANAEDLPIPETYKFDDRDGLGPEATRQVVARIEDCIDHYEQRVLEFAGFRQAIADEKERFERSVRAIFVGGAA